MREQRSSAAYRIAFTYSAVFALVILILGGAVYYAADAAFRSQQDASIAEESAELIRDYRLEGVGDVIEHITARERAGATDPFRYALITRDGRRIAGGLKTAAVGSGWRDITFLDPDEGPDPARALVTVLPGDETLIVAADSEAVERIDRIVLTLFAAAFAVFVVVAGVGALVLGGYLRRRIERISGTARAVAAGDLGRRVPIGPKGDEFDRLAGYLNAMLDRIQQLMDNLRQVSSDVAHDLRTPLGRLRSGLESAIDGPRDLEAQRAGLKEALHQSDALLSLFGGILRISEIEGGAIARGFGPVDLSALLHDLCESYTPAIADGGRSLDCRIGPGMELDGDPELIAQAIINLLDNAQRHTPPGTRIALSSRTGQHRLLIEVADDGPGVPSADRARIVHRFVRLDRSRTTPGHGLGLNLVSAIAALHDGALSIEDNRPGLRAIIALPATR